MKKSIINFVLIGISAVSVLGLVFANPDPIVRNQMCQYWCPYLGSIQFWNSIVFDLSIGAISSVLFYVLLVALPSAGRHRKLRRSLIRRYDEFKRESIAQLIYATGEASADLSEIEALMNPQAFKEYFDGDLWNAAYDSFSYDQHHRYFEDTVLAVRHFKVEVDFALGQMDIDDDETFEHLKLLSDSLDRLTRATRDYDSVKSMFRELWSIFTGWSFIDGQSGRDRIRDLLEEV